MTDSAGFKFPRFRGRFYRLRESPWVLGMRPAASLTLRFCFAAESVMHPITAAAAPAWGWQREELPLMIRYSVSWAASMAMWSSSKRNVGTTKPSVVPANAVKGT